MYDVSAGHEDIAALTIASVFELGAVYEPGELTALADLTGPEWAAVDAQVDALFARADIRPDDALLDEVINEYDAQLAADVTEDFDFEGMAA
ncbi:MAG TPA: hypothetical protein VM490_24285 [Armatimonadaceae bacterium]|jgi:hypothetical protein|nr:hypothetical protein [Armatimonadaceae bacterium]